jgi:hypothetical protein
MIQQASYNCIVCANEFDESSDELHSVANAKLNVSKFRICQACLDNSDPADDYREARSIINSYLKISEAKIAFSEVKNILSGIKK